MTATKRRPRRPASELILLAALSYIPLLLTAPGKVAADTKAYLYLDPGRLLSRAVSLWDPNVGMATVTHQNIGYLWPMGPWFWLFDRLGVPDWIAQRLWMGTLLFAAAAGVVYLGRTIGPLSRQAWTAGALVYMLSPYVLDYVSRISVLLLPWAALPWLIGLAHRSLRTGSWWHPAIFALVVATAGGINATALVLAGLGPVLWIVAAWRVHGEVNGWRAAATVARIGLLTVVCNLWWIAGLAVQSGWGLDVLRYTETVETVARTSLASEVLRHLGYWFFYGTDKVGAWIEPGSTFTEQAWLIAVGFVIPVVAFGVAFMVRWRYRAFAVGLVLVGTWIAVGAYPYDQPSPLGSVFRHFATSSTVGLALRSTARVIPLVVLGQAMLIAAGLAALARRHPGVATRAATGTMLVAAVANPALWTGGFVADNLRRPEHVPSYWTEAAAWLDRRGDDTRVLELPGSDFASYRWGNSVDPITPGLMDRPWVARELIPFGTEPSADLLIALDHRIQEGILDPSALVPVARLMGIGDVVLRSDLEYERYRTARPSQVWDLIEPRLAGLRRPVTFGRPRENEASSKLPMHDEVYFAERFGLVRPPVAAVPVRDPLPIVRVRSSGNATVLAGDGEGVVDAAAAGLLGGDGVLLSAPGLAGRPSVLARAVRSGARLVITDTNRKRARRWGTVRDNEGYTERPDEKPLRVDPQDNRMPIYPAETVDDRTTVEQRGVARVEATAYGNTISYSPGDRPANAFDGDLASAWSVGTFGPVGGHRLLVETTRPVTTDSIDVVQALAGRRRITRLGVVLDGHKVTSATIGDESFSPEGQRLDLDGRRTFTTLELVIEGDNVGRRHGYADQNGVGLAEVRVPGVTLDEVVDMPAALLDRAGAAAAAANPISIVMSRLRASPLEPFARDEERHIVRSFRLPAARTFTLSGDARVNSSLSDDRLDLAVGGVARHTVRSSGRLPGDLDARASSAIDGDTRTVWTNRLGPQTAAWLEVEGPSTVTIDQLALQVVADGEHSVPTHVTIETNAGRRTIRLPAVRDVRRAGHVASVPVRFEALTGRRFRITFDEVRAVKRTDWFSKKPIAMPVAVAELGLPGFGGKRSTHPIRQCLTGVLSVDGVDVAVEVAGDADRVGVRPLAVQLCGGNAGGLNLGAGEHEVRTAVGEESGFDLDRLVLDTGDRPDTSMPVADRNATVHVRDSGRTSFDLQVRGEPGKPVWLVLGQSQSDGWHATVAGVDLGESVIADGYANGWLVVPGRDGVVDVKLRWKPQQIVWGGLAASIAGVVLCLGILIGGRRGRRRALGVVGSEPVWVDDPFVAGPPVATSRAVVLGVVVGLVTGVVVHPVLGVAVGAGTIAALRAPHGRAIGAGAVGLLAAAAVFTVVKQATEHFVADFGWTDFFHPAHLLAGAALALLGTLLIVDHQRRRGS